MAHSQSNHNAAFSALPFMCWDCSARAFQVSHYKSCNHTPLSPSAPTPTPSVRFPLQREAITDCVCVVCLCVLHWAIHDSTKLESRPSPICSAPEAQTTTVSVQAEEMRIRMYLSRCIQYMCACVCVCECIPTLQSFDGRGLWRQTMPKGGEDHRGADSRLLKAQPRPFSSSTWENTCHSH